VISKRELNNRERVVVSNGNMRENPAGKYQGGDEMDERIAHGGNPPE
jgi:hypothetical protein